MFKSTLYLLVSAFLFISFIPSEIVSLKHNDLPYESVNLEFINIEDINQSVLVDGLPVYFTCDFEILNKSLSIMFARRENANSYFGRVLSDYAQVSNNDQFQQYYESVHVKNLRNPNEVLEIEATAMLLLNLDTFQKLQTRTNKPEYLKTLIKSQNETNLRKFFNIFLNFQGLLGSDRVRIDLFHISNHQSDAYSNEIRPISIVNKRINKPSNLNVFSDSNLTHSSSVSKRWLFTKTDVTIEVCIHLINSIFHATQKFLNTTNADYVEHFLSVIFSKSISNVNKVYESMKSRHLNFKVKLVELVIHKIPLRFEFGQNEMKDLLNVNEFVKDYYARQNASNRCDHVFFVHDKKFNHSLGMALVSSICSPNQKSSINYYDLGNIDYIFAHELGHSVGALHDTPSTCNENYTIMWSSFNAYTANFAFSTCTAKAFEENLIDLKTMEVKDSFKCILQSKNEKNALFESYKNLVRKKLPGDFFSLSEQCRLLTNDSNSYVCRMERRGDDACKEMGCAKNGSCLNYIPLDGSPCETNKVCYMFKCVPMSRFANKIGLLSEHNKAIDLMKNTCPTGLNQEERARLLQNERFISIDYKGKSCRDVLFNTSINTNNRDLCENDQFAMTCCDECLKYKLLKCGNTNRNCQIQASCESLGRNPCFNGAECVEKNTTTNHGNFDLPFECKCKKGYTGPFCLKLDACSLNPCNENKLCFSIGDLGQYTCLCETSEYSEGRYETSGSIRRVKRSTISFCILLFVLVLSFSLIGIFFKKTTNINK